MRRFFIMKSESLISLEQLQQWLEQGHKCWLCTIVSIQGAGPRPLGALMVLNANGNFVGSLSGGCIEEDLQQALTEGRLAVSKPELVNYGITPEQNERLSLPCGGKLEVLIEPCSEALLPALAELITDMRARKSVSRRVDLKTGEWQIQVGQSASLEFDNNYLLQPFVPAYVMVLVGGNALGRALAELATGLDYQVEVIEPRPATAASWDVPGTSLHTDMPDDVLRGLLPDPRTIVLTLTHDPRVDDMALMEALQHDAFYIGALGSSRTSEKRRVRLQALELSEAQIDRLHAPVGLNIGSKTPLEIAIAILAELTALRNGRQLH